MIIILLYLLFPIDSCFRGLCIGVKVHLDEPNKTYLTPEADSIFAVQHPSSFKIIGFFMRKIIFVFSLSASGIQVAWCKRNQFHEFIKSKAKKNKNLSTVFKGFWLYWLEYDQLCFIRNIAKTIFTVHYYASINFYKSEKLIRTIQETLNGLGDRFLHLHVLPVSSVVPPPSPKADVESLNCL